MFIECPKCSKRYTIEKRNQTYEIICVCSERLTVLPWLSYRQNITEPGEMECSVCKRKYDLSKYRNKTEIACNCGNLITIQFPDEFDSSWGRRKQDQMSKELQTKLHGLIDTSRLIHCMRDIDKLLLLIVREATEMLNSEGCSVILHDHETHELVFHSVTGTKSSTLTEFRLAEGEGVVGNCVSCRESIIVNDVEKDTRFSKRADKESGFSTRNILCLPLIVENECIGALEMVNKKNNDDFNEEDLILGEAISNQIAVAIHNVQLTDAALKAERLAAIGQAVTGVAHCVNNMLNGLEGGFYVLESDIEDKFGEKPERGFDMLGRNIKRLKDLVQDMLTYSKDRKPEIEPTNINELCQSVIELMQVKAEERKIKLNFKPDKMIKKIEIDPKGVYRCILNLVSNAIDACEKEGSTITLSTFASDPDFLSVEVEDQGTGIDEETLQSIFKPFFSKKGSKGTGLGLSVTQKIIEEHGGKIEVDSELNKGSKFTLYLPLERVKT
ncbi:MAG: GAF domain-containing protein [Spirochaetota bacterium]|nr:MAG: GAF domain-containing protein [Spirochaetota bacterium]